MVKTTPGSFLVSVVWCKNSVNLAKATFIHMSVWIVVSFIIRILNTLFQHDSTYMFKCVLDLRAK